MKSVKLEAGKAYDGEIPQGAVRLVLSVGIQATGEVTLGSGEPQPLYYGKNEYTITNETSYKVESEQEFEFVEDFVMMPPTIDEYMETKFTQMSQEMNNKLADHETRITALEQRPGPPVEPPATPQKISGTMATKEPSDDYGKSKSKHK